MNDDEVVKMWNCRERKKEGWRKRGEEDRWSEGREMKADMGQKAGGNDERWWERGSWGVLRWTGERRLAVWF